MLWIFFNQSLYSFISTTAQPQQIKFDGLYQMVTKRPGKECIKYHMLWILFNQSMYYFTSESQLQLNHSSTTTNKIRWLISDGDQRPGKECIKYQMLWIFFNQSLYSFISTTAQPQQIKFDGLYQMVTKRPGKECIK